MAITTFAPNTIAKSSEVNANFTGLSDGSLDTTANSLQSFRDEGFFDFVVSGLVWTADSAGVNRNASMTSGVVVINGRRIVISSVTARTFTASKDTYIDILDNLDGTGTLVYTEVANNAASPALAANSIRIGIIITGATFITSSSSINQGQYDCVLPIASSIPYTYTDSLGNLICNRSPSPTVIGYRQVIVNFTSTSTVGEQIVGLSVPVIVPTGRKIKVKVYCTEVRESGAAKFSYLEAWDGTVGSGTKVASGTGFVGTAAAGHQITAESAPLNVTGSKTYNAAKKIDVAGGTTLTGIAAGATPAFIEVQLVA